MHIRKKAVQGMKGIKMYTKIQKLKEHGVSQNKAAQYLGIHRKTIKL